MVNPIIFKTINTVLCLVHKEKDFTLINAFFKEFNLSRNNYQKIRHDIEMDLYLPGEPDRNISAFEETPAIHFYYEVVLDICNQTDYIKRIVKIADKLLEEEYKIANSTIDTRRLLNVLKTIDTPIPYRGIGDNPYKSLVTQIEEQLEETHLEESKRYHRYLDKQKKIIYETLFSPETYTPEKLYEKIMFIVDSAFEHRINDIVSDNFGYMFLYNEVDCKKEKAVIEKIVKTEIDRYLLNMLICKEGIGLGQISSQASIDEKDVSVVFINITKSCEEYFYFREIANVQRKQVLKDIFENRECVKVVSASKECEELQKEKEILLNDNALLMQNVKVLTNEVETLKKNLVSKEKELDNNFRTVREEYDKKFMRQKLLIEGMTKQNIGFALLTQVLSAREDEEELLFPYKLEEIQNKKILILGGRDETRRELSKILPQAVFINNETRKEPTTDFDCVFVFNMFLNHSLFFKYIKVARKNNIPVGYTPSTNKERIFSDMYQAIKRIKELVIPEAILD